MEDKIDLEEPFTSEDFVTQTAYNAFGIKYLYPWQRLVVANILEAYEYQKNKTDYEEIDEDDDSFCKGRQIVLLPTGAGKSLCFQIPALILDGPSLIIYPLLALMTDQQRRMEEGSLRSVTFRGGQTEEEQNENFRKIKEGAQIILANPEVLQSEKLLERLKTVGIKHIAIDEAHCTSEWGDSFRPAYLGLGKVIEVLNPPMITAFTATASPEVLKRVSEILFNGEAHIVRSDSDRQNMTGERFTSEKPDPTKAESKTVEEFIALADVNTYYKLTGTVSGFNSKYCSFDLTDSTGKIYVYGLTDESKTQYASVIKDGGTVTLSGKYSYFEKSSKHEVVEAVILNYEEPQSHVVETENISDVFAAAIGDTIIFKNALVVAAAKTGYLVTDSLQEDYILVFQKTEGSDTPVAVGDVVNVTSVKVEYNSMPQLASPATTIVSSGTPVTWPNPEDITDTFDSFTSTSIKYVSFTGTLSVNGSYYNVAVNGATTNIGSMLPSAAADSWKGVPNTTFEGYYLYTASSKYIYTIYTKATPSTEPYLAVTPKSASVAAIAGSTTINVSSNVEWTATSDNADFTVSPASGEGDGTITVTYTENTTESARVANITVATANDTALIPITQAAPGAVTYTLQFTKNSSNTAYANMFDVTVNEIGWKAPGNQGLDADATYGGKIKIGGKLSAATDRYMYSKSPIGGALNKITFRHGSKDSQITVNSVTVSSYSTAADAESGTNAKDTQTVTYVDNDETSINVSGENWTGKYIRINYNLSSSAPSSNKGIILFYVKFDY